EPEMDDAILLIVVDELDIPAVGVQCRPDRAEDLLDLLACTHWILLPETGHCAAVRPAVQAASPGGPPWPYRFNLPVGSTPGQRRAFRRKTARSRQSTGSRAARIAGSHARGAEAPQPDPVDDEQGGGHHHEQAAGRQLPPRLELHRTDVILTRRLE